MTSDVSSSITAVPEAAPEQTVRGDLRCRVLVVEQGEGLWGAQRYLLRLAPLLAERGVEQVLAAPADSATAVQWRAAGFRHVVLDSPAHRSVRGPGGQLRPSLALREFGRTLRLGRDTARLARELDVDVIQANSHWSHLEAVVAGYVGARRRKVVLHLHEENEPDLVGKLRAVAVMAADATIAVSTAVAASLPARATRHVQVVRNGVDTRAMAPGPADPAVRAQLSDAPDAPVVLSMSRLDPRKGVDQVIKAVAALPDALSATRLAVAGSPSLDPGHVDALRALGERLLGDRVRFLGARNDVADLLRACDVLVLASSLEGLPLSVLEAQACARPVVAYPTAGVPEVVDHDRTGLLARTNDIGDLAAQLAEVLADPELAARLGTDARDEVLAHHTLAGQADVQAVLLAELSAARRRPARRRQPA